MDSAAQQQLRALLARVLRDPRANLVRLRLRMPGEIGAVDLFVCGSDCWATLHGGLIWVSKCAQA